MPAYLPTYLPTYLPRIRVSDEKVINTDFLQFILSNLFLQAIFILEQVITANRAGPTVDSRTFSNTARLITATDCRIKKGRLRGGNPRLDAVSSKSSSSLSSFTLDNH